MGAAVQNNTPPRAAVKTRFLSMAGGETDGLNICAQAIQTGNICAKEGIHATRKKLRTPDE